MDKNIMQRQLIAMEQYGLDALVAVSTDNVAYGAGYVVPSQALGMRNRQFAVVSTRDGQSAMLLTANELDEAQERSAIGRFLPYQEFGTDPMAVLADELRGRGLDKSVIGIELDALPVARWEELTKRLPDVQWRPAADAFSTARMVKTAAEIEYLRDAARIAMEGQQSLYPTFDAGMTEHEAYRLLSDQMLGRGADKIVMIQVAAGERSIYSNPSPGPTTFKSGEAVKVDVFVTKHGYLSDTGRSVVIGSASQRQKDTWAKMNDVMDLIRNAVRPGVTTREIWDLFVREFEQRSMAPAIRFLGHGLGLSLHEEPFIAEHSDTVLQPGMVFAIEPICVDDGNGYHLEDILLVTDDGYENLTPDFARDLVVC